MAAHESVPGGSLKQAILDSTVLTARLDGKVLTGGRLDLSDVTGSALEPAPEPSPTAPAAPALTATAGVESVSLTWTTPDDGGSAITGYEIEQLTPNAWTLVVDPATTSWTGTVLAAGVEHTYVLRALNDVGKSANSNVASATPTAASSEPAPASLTFVSVTPSVLPVGATTVTITGTGFVPGTTVVVEDGKGPDPTAGATTVSSDGTSLVVTIEVSRNGPGGSNAFDLRLTRPDGATVSAADIVIVKR